MMLLNARLPVTLALLLAAVGCLKSSQPPEAPARRGAQNGCGKSTPPPSSSGGGGAYLTGVTAEWKEIKAIIEKSCKDCHAGYVEYETAKEISEKLADRTTDGSMPSSGDKLSIEDRMKFVIWHNNGAPNDGETPPAEPALPGEEQPGVEPGNTKKPNVPGNEQPEDREPRGDDDGEDEGSEESEACT